MWNTKAPAYTPREVEALRSASIIVARVHINGNWHEQAFAPEGAEKTARDVLKRIQHAIRFNRDFAGIVLYAEGISGGTKMRACVPHNWVPEELA